MTSRRRLLIALGAFALLRGTPARGQPTIRRVGFLYLGSRRSAMETGRYSAFVEGMRDLGYVEGKNVVLDARFADGASERVAGLVSETLQSNPEVIVATGISVYAALKQATRTVPVVMTVGADPVGEGYAATLPRPGGNFTGFSTRNVELFPKQVELLKTAVQKLSRLALLSNSGNPAHPARLKAMRASAIAAGVHIFEVNAPSAEAIERGFATMHRQRADALVILNDTFFTQQREQIAALALKYRLPSLYGAFEYPEAGGFMGYGQNTLENFRGAATFVDKILKGAKPGDLPIEQPMRLRLAINRRTAKAIGVVIPRELLLRADRVIE